MTLIQNNGIEKDQVIFMKLKKIQI